MTQSDDLYEVLQVHPSADAEVIKAAYQKLALKYHPDRNKTPYAAETMKRLNHAYEVLKSPSKRAAYDQERLTGPPNDIGGSAAPGEASWSRQDRSEAPPPFKPPRRRFRTAMGSGLWSQWPRILLDIVLVALFVGALFGATRLLGAGSSTGTMPIGPTENSLLENGTPKPGAVLAATPTPGGAKLFLPVTPTPAPTPLPNPLPTATPPPPSPSPTPLPTPGVVFTYIGKGPVNSPPFDASASPWKLEYKTSWTGSYVVSAFRTKGGEGVPVVNQDVTAGTVYQTYIYNLTGPLYLSIGPSVPLDGEWTVWVSTT